MKNLIEDDIVLYDNVQCEVVKVWNHGGNNVYYDLIETEPSLPDILPDYYKEHCSIPFSSIQEKLS